MQLETVMSINRHLPANGTAGQSLLFDLVQLDEQKRPVGGVTATIVVKA